MLDLALRYRESGSERREDWLRMLACDNGLPLAEVQRAADGLGEPRTSGGWSIGARDTGTKDGRNALPHVDQPKGATIAGSSSTSSPKSRRLVTPLRKPAFRAGPSAPMPPQ